MSEIIVTKKGFSVNANSFAPCGKNAAPKIASRAFLKAENKTAAAKTYTAKAEKSRADAKETVKDVLLFLFLSLFAVLLLASGKCAEFTLNGIKLWAAVVLPSLFPYFFISAALTRLNAPERLSKLFSPLFKKVFAVSGIISYAFFISVISGCPVGAKIVSDLKENGFISEEEGARASVLCSVFSPSFIISGIGSAFGSVKFGVALFCCHIFSDICAGVIFSFYKRNSGKVASKCENIKKTEAFANNQRKKENKTNGAGNFLYECAYNSVLSVLVVGGLITLFSVLCSLLEGYGILTPVISLLTVVTKSRAVSEGIVFGAIECTGGIYRLSSLGACKSSFVAAAGICGFGGVSAIAQSLAYLKKAKIKAAPFVLARFAAAALNCLFALIVYGICF